MAGMTSRSSMGQDQKHAEVCNNESRHWPVSLLGCFQSTSHAPQLPWPWLMLKACLCPASVLGANETLFQGEEPADVCCLQPYSFCGPTCRGMNAQLCGLGNEGLKLCAHTCILQAACSCLCLGLPYVAWLSALQRQRVMAKHGVSSSEEDAWATACYPCSLLQMHALLQQQQQGLLSPHRQQRQTQQASAPLRAPKVQQMTACTSEAASQASSYAGPLTSAITSSKVLRAVRDHPTRSDGAAAAPAGSHATGHSSRLGPRDSLDSTGASSLASETGVVNSPMMERTQQQPTGCQEAGHESSRTHTRGDLSARLSNSRRTSARNSSDGNTGSSKQRLAPGTTAYLRPPPPAAQQQQLGPLMSARSHSSNGGAAFNSQQQLLPPRLDHHARHCRTVSLGSEDAADASAAAGGYAGGNMRCGNSSMAGSDGFEGLQPDPPISARSSRQKRKLPGRAAMASQSCHLPGGFYSSNGISCRMGVQDSRVEYEGAALQAPLATAGAGAGAAATLTASESEEAAAAGPRSSSTPLQPGLLGADSTPPPHLYSSCKASVGGSCSSKLLTFSQEDVPLSAFKPNPGKAQRRASTGVSGSAGGAGWLQQGQCSNSASLTGSLHHQQQQGLQQQEHVGAHPSGGSNGEGGSAASSNEPGAADADRQQLRRPGDSSSGGTQAEPAGLAALVADVGAASNMLQLDPQFATMQSDICNFASWLPEPAAHNSMALNAADAGQLVQQQQDQQQQQQQQGVKQECSEGDMCNYKEPLSPRASSPKPAVSPQVVRKDTATAAGGVGAAAAAAAAVCAARPTALAAAWAYMSDICNLGGSFDAASSAIGRSGLAAAVLSRLAEESSSNGGTQQQQQQQQGPNGQECDAVNASRNNESQPQQQSAAAAGRAAAAAGSWPDTAPSPPHATLVTEPTGGCGAAGPPAAAAAAPEDVAAAAAAAGTSKGSVAAAGLQVVGDINVSDGDAAGADAAADDSDDEVSSPPRRKRRGAAGSAYAFGADHSSSGTVASSSDRGSQSQQQQQQGACEASTTAPAAEYAAPVSAVDGLDPRLLAAVTGTTSRDQLTASQEELAAKLARLAFANPAAARQLGGYQQQQQQQQQRQQHRQEHSHQNHGQQIEQQQHQQQHGQARCFEPFYPTVMSDICNLADPDDGQDLPVRESSQRTLDGHLPAAAAGRVSQQQQWQPAGGPGSIHQTSRPPGLPAGAAGAVAGGSAGSRRPSLPGRPLRQQPSQQQQQQQVAAATSRLGRPTVGGAPPAGSPVVAEAGGVKDTAGPLRAALLLRGLQAAPGGAKPMLVGAGGHGAAAAAAGGGAGSPAAAAAALGRRMACPGDAAGDARIAAAVAGGGNGSLSSLQGSGAGHGGEESLASFDSYYVDCDLRHPGDAEVANMITNNPLYTFATSEGGGTVDSARFSPRLKQQLRDASNGGGGGLGSPGRQSPSQQQQQGGAGSGRGVKGVTSAAAMNPTTAAAGGGGRGVSAVHGQQVRQQVSSDHDDGAQQPDNSRSSSPASMLVAGNAAVFAAAAAAAPVDKGYSKAASRVGAGRAGASAECQ